MNEIPESPLPYRYRVRHLGNGLVNVSDRNAGVLLVAGSEEIVAPTGRYTEDSPGGREVRSYLDR